MGNIWMKGGREGGEGRYKNPAPLLLTPLSSISSTLNLPFSAYLISCFPLLSHLIFCPLIIFSADTHKPFPFLCFCYLQVTLPSTFYLPYPLLSSSTVSFLLLLLFSSLYISLFSQLHLSIQYHTSISFFHSFRL